MILLHGRMQPPHSGHIQLAKYFLDRYTDCELVISLDVRNKDNNNPFSFDYRKQRIERKLNQYKNRIHVIPHVCENFTIQCCIDTIYNNFYKNFPKREISMVVGGRDAMELLIPLWGDKGIYVEYLSTRFYGISGTKIRNRIKRWNS